MGTFFLLLFLLLLFILPKNLTLRFLFVISAQCGAPLGMESGAIKDEDITASSSFESGNVGPQHGR